MIYLLLAIFSSVMVSVTMRLSTNKVSGDISMLATNYLMCVAIAGVSIGSQQLFPLAADGLGQTLLFGGINGFLYAFSFILFQMNVQRNGVVLSATFMKLGLLVPMVLSIFLFQEIPTFLQLIGFSIAIVAIIMINSVSQEEKTEANFTWGLILLLLAGGCGDAMSKVFEEMGNPLLAAQFLFYTFLVALLFCLVLVVKRKEKIGKNEICYGFLVGIPNYFSAKFLLKSLSDISAVIAYPTYSVATLFIVTVIGVVFFHERLMQRQWLALGLILIALILLNIV
ncbi:MAG: EamA family transporter [Peptococcaceae bacterium]|nr:EamA family transporter [Peptococcaceae bacterium]